MSKKTAHPDEMSHYVNAALCSILSRSSLFAIVPVFRASDIQRVHTLPLLCVKQRLQHLVYL